MPPEELRSALQSTPPFPAQERPETVFAKLREQVSSDSQPDDLATELEAARDASPLRRDFNLIRAILLEAEEPGAHAFNFDEFDRRMVQNHLQLLIEGGFLTGSIMREGAGLSHVVADRLTWSGHDLLALMKNPSVWQKARTQLLDKGGRANLDLIVAWLKQQASAATS
jgi:hypothetical protein